MPKNTSRAAIIIPARFDSTRFPGKPLAQIHGISMIERVWRIANRCQQNAFVAVTTDSEQIAEHVKKFNATVIMTSSTCQTGTDRVAEACKTFSDENMPIISLQGDAVLTPPWVIDQMILEMQNDESVEMVTPAVKLTQQALHDFLNHKIVSPSSGTTVVFDKNQNAMYFSKQPIPYLYKTEDPDACLYRHIGLYGYRFKTLKQLQSLPQSPIEKLEKLEQLRALENGIPIRVVCVDYKGRTHGSVDTPQDVSLIESIIQKEGELV